MEIVQFRAMNTDIFIGAEGDARIIAPGIEKAKKFIFDSERRFTRFSEDSELSQLNRSAGTWFRPSNDLFDLLLLAQGYVELTAGLFDPSVLPDLQRAGYDRSMDLIRAAGGLLHEPYLPGRRPVQFDEILIRPDEQLIYLPPGLMLDLGGIAKGWIAEQAANILLDYSPVAAVNAGGDMFLIGIPEGKEAWPIALGDPRHPGKNLAMLLVPPGAVATSSVAKRVWKQGQMQRHHLIDPRTHEPAVTDWLSVTAISAHADLSEVFAKALLIAGPQEADLISKNAQISYIAVDRDGNLVGTQESLEYIYDK